TKMQSNNRISKYLIISLLLIGGWHSTSAQEAKGFVADKIIAKIDNYIILKSELEGAYQNYLSNGGTASEETRCGILSQLVMTKLLVAKAEIDSVVVTSAEVDANTEQRMNMILQNSNNSPEQLERAYGKTLEQIKVELRDQVREQLLSNEMQRKITKTLSITPAEVRRFFSRVDSLPLYSSDVEVAQIVRVAKVSEEQKNVARRKLMDIRERILAGENFNELARKYSEDPSAQYNGGEYGYVGRGTMVPTYEAMAFKVKPGEISLPFESPFGFHILQLIDRRGNEYNTRGILIAAAPSKDDLKLAEKFLDSLRRKIIADSTKFEQAAKQFSDDQRTKGYGGFFTDQDGGTKISIKDLDPVVYFAIDSMKEGNVSRPLTYRTDDGKDAMRILYFKRRLPAHEANLKDDWHRIQAAALAQKKDKMLDKWFTKARQDVFIKIDPAYKGCKIVE
ncbi:MAG TPA: peptidylprolyl isomerase, partial [Cyclobacteriaceae bacterium]|nr:peptidylprolyl isomerase [Cyclobacteriaceae bacterium]